jgi:hypothetical protein
MHNRNILRYTQISALVCSKERDIKNEQNCLRFKNKSAYLSTPLFIQFDTNLIKFTTAISCILFPKVAVKYPKGRGTTLVKYNTRVVEFGTTICFEVGRVAQLV